MLLPLCPGTSKQGRASKATLLIYSWLCHQGLDCPHSHVKGEGLWYGLHFGFIDDYVVGKACRWGCNQNKAPVQGQHWILITPLSEVLTMHDDLSHAQRINTHLLGHILDILTKATTQVNNATQIHSKHITWNFCEKTCSMNNPFQVGSQINLALVIIIPTVRCTTFCSIICKFRSMILSLKPHVRLINFTTQGALENECELFSLKLQCC